MAAKAALVALSTIAFGTLRAQGSVEFRVAGGLSVQSDAATIGGVQLSPVGVIGGLDLARRTASGMEFGIDVSTSFYPQLARERTTLVAPPAADSEPDGGFTLTTIAAEFGPRPRHGASWFACAGAAIALASPRPHHRSAPMACVGIAAPFNDRYAVRFSYQQMIGEVGRTRFQIPLLISYTPF